MPVSTLEQLVDAAGIGRKDLLNKSEPNANDPREYTVVLYRYIRNKPVTTQCRVITKEPPPTSKVLLTLLNEAIDNPHGRMDRRMRVILQEYYEPAIQIVKKLRGLNHEQCCKNADRCNCKPQC